jgi:hypothetical protein
MLRKYWLTPLMSALCLLNFASPSSPEVIEGFPDIIVCNKGSGGKIVLTIVQTFADGSAAYRGRGNTVAIVGVDSVIRREGAADCNGKSLGQLRSEGKAFDFVK